MRFRMILILLALAAMAVCLAGILYEDHLLESTGRLLFVFPLLGYYGKQIPAGNWNFYGFLVCVLAANVLGFFVNWWYLNLLAHGLWMGAFIFLSREALRTTQYSRGRGFMIIYFLLVVTVYGYLLSLHILEIEASLSNRFEFSLYLLYYVNLLILGVTALIYYLNSFSRKSVFFISLTLTFIVADVLRDMGVFYFRDLSVEISGSLIKFAALKLVFLFFVTREKKLRLLNLV